MVYGDVSAIEPGTNKSSIHAGLFCFYALGVCILIFSKVVLLHLICKNMIQVIIEVVPTAQTWIYKKKKTNKDITPTPPVTLIYTPLIYGVYSLVTGVYTASPILLARQVSLPLTGLGLW